MNTHTQRNRGAWREGRKEGAAGGEGRYNIDCYSTRKGANLKLGLDPLSSTASFAATTGTGYLSLLCALT